MKVAIVTLTTTAKRTGVAEYLINLLNELQKIDGKNLYYVFTGRDNRYMFSFTSPNFLERRLWLSHNPSFVMRPLFHFWLIFILPLWCKRNGINLVHLPNTLFVSKFMPVVSTIHDVVEIKTRKYPAMRTYFRKLMINSAIRNSKHLITVSDSTATDLREMGARKVSTIHLGFINLYATFMVDEGVLKRHGLDGVQYVLFIGTLMRHKNIPVLINAVASARKSISDLKLVLIGAPDNDFLNILAAIKNQGLEKAVILLNYTDHHDKMTLLKNANSFCFISSYEGFGIPILEAQSAGVPVIVNNISSLPEVGGKGAYLVESQTLEESTARAIVKIAKDVRLRSELIDAGFKNLSRFSWNQCAVETLQIYNQIAK